MFLLEKMRTIDKSRLIKKLRNIEPQTQIELCDSLQEMFTYLNILESKSPIQKPVLTMNQTKTT